MFVLYLLFEQFVFFPSIRAIRALFPRVEITGLGRLCCVPALIMKLPWMLNNSNRHSLKHLERKEDLNNLQQIGGV